MHWRHATTIPEQPLRKWSFAEVIFRFFTARYHVGHYFDLPLVNRERVTDGFDPAKLPDKISLEFTIFRANLQDLPLAANIY